MLRGFWAVMGMAWRTFVRDKHALFWGIAFPLMLMGLIGSVFGGTTELVLSVSVVNEEENALGRGIVAALHEVTTLRITEEAEEAALDALRAGRRNLVVVLPSLPSQAEGPPRAEGIEPLSVRVYYDEGSVEVAQTGVAIVGGVVNEFNRQLTGRQDVLTVDAAGVSAHELSMFDFLLPGILAMVFMQNGLMGVTATVSSYRRQLVLKRVLTTPFPPAVFLAGIVGRFTLTNLMQGVIVAVVGVLLFGATIVGSYGNLLVLSIIGSIVFLTIGFAIATLSETPDAANMFGSAVAFPMMFLSGTFWPRELIPEALQPLIDVLPLTPLVEAMRGVATRADTLTMHADGLLYMGGWTVLALVVAVWRFRWE